MKYGYRILIAFAACFLLFGMNGCKKNRRDVFLYSPSGENEKISITFFGFKADAMNLTAIESAMQSFMEKNKNIDITYEGIKGLAYWSAFDKRVAANVLDDVFMIQHDRIVEMGGQGKLADLSKLLGVENYSAAAKIQFTNSEDGTVYFLPTAISTYNLYINYDLLKKHGQSVPANWAEFQKVCDYFVGKGIVPVIANNYKSLVTLILSRGLFDIYQKPEPVIDETLKKFNETPSLFADALGAGVEMAAQFLERGWIDAAETLATEQTSDDLKIFVKGERPFMISGGWASPRVMAMKPDFVYGIHPYPILEDGSVLPMQIDTCISVNAQSKNLEAAKSFVEYLISPDVMWNYCDSQSSYTPLKDERLPSDKTLIPSIEYLSNGRHVFSAEYRLDLPVETSVLDCSRALLNGSTAKEAQKILGEALQK